MELTPTDALALTTAAGKIAQARTGGGLGKDVPPEPTSENARQRWLELRRIAFANSRHPDRRVAAFCWERVVEAEPTDSVARYALGWLYVLLGNPLLALSHLSEVSADAANFERVRELQIKIAQKELKRIERRITPQNIEDYAALLRVIEPVLENDPILVRIRQFATYAEPADAATANRTRGKMTTRRAAARNLPARGSVPDIEYLALADRLDDNAPDASALELTEIRERVVLILPSHPELAHLFVHYCERRNHASQILSFLRGVRQELLSAKDWMETAHVAARAGGKDATREFFERAFVRSGCSPAIAARVSPIFLKNGLEAEAIAIWDRVQEEGSAFQGRLGLIRILSKIQRHEELFSCGVRILESAAPLARFAAPDQGRLVEIARRTTSASRTLFSETGNAARPGFLEHAASDAWTDWLRALFAQAHDDSSAALELLERWSNGPNNSVATIDFNAEIGMVQTQCRRYGAALAAFDKAAPEALSSNPSYKRRHDEVRAVAEFCGDGTVHEYPESLIDVLLGEIARAPLTYEPRPRSLLTVCGTLGQGGGERQTITILRRLSKESGISDLSLAVRFTDGPGQAFFLPQVRAIPLEPIVYGADWRQSSILSECFGGSSPSRRMLRALELLSHSLREEIVRLCRVIFETRPAAVHIRQDMYGSALACAITGVPRFFIHRGSLAPDKWAYEPFRADTQLRPMRHVYRRLLETSPLVMINNSRAGSTSDRTWLESENESRFRVIYNAMEFENWSAGNSAAGEMRAKLGIRSEDFVIGGVFRFSAVKRPMFWVEVAARVARSCPEAHFLLLGDGEYSSAMREFASQQGFLERLHMPGQVQDVGPWYAAMDLNLLTSEREGLPNVLIEGQHFGVPALAPDVGGVCETLNPGITGRVLPKETGPNGFAAAALAIWRDASWRARARHEAPAFVHERFGTARAAAELLECFGFSREALQARDDV